MNPARIIVGPCFIKFEFICFSFFHFRRIEISRFNIMNNRVIICPYYCSAYINGENSRIKSVVFDAYSRCLITGSISV